MILHTTCKLNESMVVQSWKDRTTININFLFFKSKVVYFVSSSYQCRWLDNSLIAIGFRNGYIVIISTNPNEIGQEQFSRRFDENKLITASYSRVRNCLAIAGERGVKIIDLHKYKVRIPVTTYPDFYYCVTST